VIREERPRGVDRPSGDTWALDNSDTYAVSWGVWNVNSGATQAYGTDSYLKDSRLAVRCVKVYS